MRIVRCTHRFRRPVLQALRSEVVTRRVLGVIAGVFLFANAIAAQVNTPDLRQMSGVPLPTNDLPAGSISVRVVRGSFANNVADATVTFNVSGKTTEVRTDAAGRAEIKGLASGARVKASAVVDGERLETQEVTIGQSGYRFILSTSAPAGAPSGPASAAPSPAPWYSVPSRGSSRSSATTSSSSSTCCRFSTPVPRRWTLVGR